MCVCLHSYLSIHRVYLLMYLHVISHMCVCVCVVLAHMGSLGILYAGTAISPQSMEAGGVVG